ncbi:hypothetical protein F3Y22_tig00110683pilonHSYRG00332 [Hibiscus syriacus]|uniref:NB-ARC domain-containing protein n=1 Tax=Hibiscus syriacus TaxID=106335 RepID=A0A6A2ZY79_HIBSY|nr:hypothetical protein F3Y22_tig00110683pilonHSYRG00332 [Hibiscus syriacus]
MELHRWKSATVDVGLRAEMKPYLWGVEDQVKRLETELEWMQNFLDNAGNGTIHLQAAEIEMAHDADNVLYACILEDGWMLHETRSSIEKIIERSNDLVRRLSAYCRKESWGGGEGPSSSTEFQEQRRKFPHNVDDEIVGRGDDIEKLVPVVVDEKSQCRVVSICGMGGLGKTTLALDFLDEEDSRGSDEELSTKLFNFLQENKCLVILDDIWKTETWDILKPAFPIERNSKTKILLTSRNEDMASGRMEQLRHLYLPYECDDKTKLKLGTLINLLTLVNFNTENCYAENLINLENIRKLKIQGPFKIEHFNVEDFNMNPSIIEGKYLQSLSICSDEMDQRRFRHLFSSFVNIYPMPTLEKLPKLRVLELHQTTLERLPPNLISCSAQGLPKLESLSLVNLFNLFKWKVDNGAMPCLRRLEIEFCKKLKRLPNGLRFITTLQELKIVSMPKEFKDKVVQGEQDFHQVQHVPSVIFQDREE